MEINYQFGSFVQTRLKYILVQGIMQVLFKFLLLIWLNKISPFSAIIDASLFL
jgi:hypothetical protein